MTDAAESEGDYALSESPDSWTPQLRSPEDLTPLPRIDAALPTLKMFAGLVGQGRLARYRVAVLCDLVQHTRSTMRIRDVQEAIAWMAPSSVARIVQDLRRVGVLEYEPRRDRYRLDRRARTLAAMCNALTAGDVEQSRIIKVLNATIRLTDAMNAGTDAAFATFLSAIAILELDYEELRRLVDDDTEASLLEAAQLAATHVEDMRTLLDEQADLFARFSNDMRYLDHDQRAHDLVARLGGLSSDVIAGLSRTADIRLRGTNKLDRNILRAAISTASVEDLAQIVSESASRRPVFLSNVNGMAVFSDLEDYLTRIRRTPLPPPEPSELAIDSQGGKPRNPVGDAAAALEDLARSSGRLSQWVVNSRWETALNRSTSAVEAWARFGPAGDDTLTATLYPQSDVEEIRRDGVGWMSVTQVAAQADDRQR